jgi:inner membrane protease subunit 1
MVPTLGAGPTSMVVVSPLPYWAPFFGRTPARGELVTFRLPDPIDSVALRRVVGVEGDIVELQPTFGNAWWMRRAGGFERDKESPSRFVRSDPGKDDTPESVAEAMASYKRNVQPRHLRVPPEHVWCAADNLYMGLDSRHFGPVPVHQIQAKVVSMGR